ncbi:hypothetical protein SDJN02_20658, partial [Cucurbita argyrosperma subsp. argyrosperma]
MNSRIKITDTILDEPLSMPSRSITGMLIWASPGTGDSPNSGGRSSKAVRPELDTEVSDGFSSDNNSLMGP